MVVEVVRPLATLPRPMRAAGPGGWANRFGVNDRPGASSVRVWANECHETIDDDDD